MLLAVDGVEAGYGHVQVLRGLTIGVGEGERVGLFGPNGHGKTTLLRTISGLVRPWRGQIRWNGHAVTGVAPRKIVDEGLVHVPQGSVLFPRMTVIENLMLGAYSQRSWRYRHASAAMVMELFPRLAERRNQLSRTLSGGERQMVAIGMGLMARPRLLMLDEPTLGLAPRVRDALEEGITRIAETGVSLVIVDQDVNLLLRICGRQYLIEQGRVLLEMGPEQTVDRERILEMYFGPTSQRIGHT
jgi:branched-chain amino acid transport system ATP-binding protein